jgi:multiple sugar transport system ATP-binding protein
MATLALREIVKRYDSATAVDRMSIDIADGEFVSLLGPSGCGKSTILNMIAGLIPLDYGAVLIGGDDVTDFAPKDRKIAMVFQDYALYPHMTVAQNLAFPLKAIAVPAAEITVRIQTTAQSLGISDLLHRLPRELSGGQRQRVALGRATIRTPSVFLMDEPLSNLDAKLRVQMRAELKMLSQRLRTTTIYVTHDQAEAMTLSDRIAILDRGRLQQIGTPLEVYNAPTNVFVANFMGMMPMNFITGTLARVPGGAVFHSPQATIDLPGLQVDQEAARPTLMGIRPEDVSIEFAGGPGATLEVLVDMIEHLGADIYIHAAAGASRLVFRTQAERQIGMGKMRVRLNTRALHLFDAASEKRLPTKVEASTS